MDETSLGASYGSYVDSDWDAFLCLISDAMT
jgi:hypothetical protein